MGGSRRALYTLLVALIGSLSLCAAANAEHRSAATFSVLAQGTETISATEAGDGETCPSGTGTETARFGAEPFRIRIEDTGPFLELSGLSRRGEDSRQPFSAEGTVTRAADGAFTCRLEVPPDCGTKSFAGISMWLQGSSLRRGHITLRVDLHAEDPPDVFASCPALGGFPALFEDGVPQAPVTGRTLFDRRKATLVLDASHERTTEALGGSSHVVSSLKLTMRRL